MSGSQDYLCSPSKSWLERYEELADVAYPRNVVEDVVEPFRPSEVITSTPHRRSSPDRQGWSERHRDRPGSPQRRSRSRSPSGAEPESATSPRRFDRARSPVSPSRLERGRSPGSEDRGVRFDMSPRRLEAPYEYESRRSRSPLVDRGLDNVAKSPITGESIDEIVKKYSSPRELPRIDDRPESCDLEVEGHGQRVGPVTSPPSLGAQMTYSPYRGPIQDEIHTQPYYGPYVNPVSADLTEPKRVKPSVPPSAASSIINKVHNPVSDERIEELCYKYRNRMARSASTTPKPQPKVHFRSKSDNFRSEPGLDLGTPLMSRSEVKLDLGPSLTRSDTVSRSDYDWMSGRFENAVLQIEQLERNIKTLRMEVNSLTAAKKQAEMRVSIQLFQGYLWNSKTSCFCGPPP